MMAQDKKSGSLLGSATWVREEWYSPEGRERLNAELIADMSQPLAEIESEADYIMGIVSLLPQSLSGKSEEQALCTLHALAIDHPPVDFLTVVTIMAKVGDKQAKAALSQAGRKAVNARHARSQHQEKKKAIKDRWASGTFSTKQRCAEEEWEACGFSSYDSALRALREPRKEK